MPKRKKPKIESVKIPPGKRKEYMIALVASWAVPGAGHWQLGYRMRGLVLALTVLGIFWFGQVLADCRAVNRSIHPIFYCAQVGTGFSTVLSNEFWGVAAPSAGPRDLPSRVDDTLPPYLSTGILYTSIAGLLNMLLVLHVADPRTWMLRAAEERDQRERQSNPA